MLAISHNWHKLRSGLDRLRSRFRSHIQALRCAVSHCKFPLCCKSKNNHLQWAVPHFVGVLQCLLYCTIRHGNVPKRTCAADHGYCKFTYSPNTLGSRDDNKSIYLDREIQGPHMKECQCQEFGQKRFKNYSNSHQL